MSQTIEKATWLTGSRMYRMNLPDSDYDYTAIEWDMKKFMNPLLDREYSIRSDSLNLTTHSLPKVATLLVKGNFTVLDLVFHQPESYNDGYVIPTFLEDVSPYVITSRVVKAYLGYVNKQNSLAKATGRGKQSLRGRVDREEHAYEPKFTAHLVRGLYSILGIQATGNYHYMTEEELDLVMKIRRGELPGEEVHAIVGQMRAEANSFDPDQLRDSSELREVIEDFFYRLVG